MKNSLRPRLLFALMTLTGTIGLCAMVHAQAPAAPAASGAPANDGDPDGQVVGVPPPAPRTHRQLIADCWDLLSNSLADPKQPEVRTQALAALGLLGDNPRSLKMIETSMSDADLDVRTAAVLAAEQTKAAAIEPAMRKLLNDKEPQVAYAAALALWKMGDHSGGNILMAVVDGERKASANLIDGAEHDMAKTLHSPAALAEIGVTQGAGLLLGPFGFGITAYEYIKKNGGDSPRVAAIDALAQEKNERLRQEFVAALKDKDPGVRAAAAKALDSYHLPEVSAAIANLLYDGKRPVRLTAAAAYLISTHASPASPESASRPKIAQGGRRTQR